MQKAQNDSEPKARFACHTERSEVSTCKVCADKQQTHFIALACKDNLIKIYAYKATLFATNARNLKTLDDKNLAQIYFPSFAKISLIKAVPLMPTAFSTREFKSKMLGFCPKAFVALSAAATLSAPSPPARANSLS